jgi:hypothetical protein
LCGNLGAGFERVALVQTGDNDLLGMLKAGCSEPQRLGANAGFLPAQFRRKLGAEIFRLEKWANLDLAILVVRIGAALDPLDRLFFGTCTAIASSRRSVLWSRRRARRSRCAGRRKT